MKQISGRLNSSDASNPYGYLVTDKDAYMDIVNSAKNGNKNAENFISDMEDFVDKSGNQRLWLVEGLWSDSNRIVNNVKTEIQEREKHETTIPSF